MALTQIYQLLLRRISLLLGVEEGVDMIVTSFIRNTDGVKEIRNVLEEKKL